MTSPFVDRRYSRGASEALTTRRLVPPQSKERLRRIIDEQDYWINERVTQFNPAGIRAFIRRKQVLDIKSLGDPSKVECVIKGRSSVFVEVC